MTNEQKQLLLIDLCARLPYGVYIHIRYKTGEPCYGKLTLLDIKWFIESKIETMKPYLRPMSSMTEEEKSVWYSFMEKYQGFPDDTIHINKINDYQDWLNKNHFDYRGLIPMGLALEAPEDMYETE